MRFSETAHSWTASNHPNRRYRKVALTRRKEYLPRCRRLAIRFFPTDAGIFQRTSGLRADGKRGPASLGRSVSPQFARSLLVNEFETCYSRALCKKSNTRIFIEPVNGALPCQIGGGFVVTFGRRIAIES